MGGREGERPRAEIGTYDKPRTKHFGMNEGAVNETKRKEGDT